MTEVPILTSTAGGGCDTCAKFTNPDLVSKLVDGIGGKLDRLLQVAEKGEEIKRTKKVNVNVDAEDEVSTQKAKIRQLFDKFQGEVQSVELWYSQCIETASRGDDHTQYFSKKERLIMEFNENAVKAMLELVKEVRESPL
jgi:hypothetical protein